MNSEYIVFTCRDHYNPLGIVRTLGEAGIKPIVIAIANNEKLRLASRSKYVKKYHEVSDIDEGYQVLLSYAQDGVMSYVLTGDDTAVLYLDSHYEDLKDYFYFYNSGGKVGHYMDKTTQYEIAKRLGFNVLKTWRLSLPCNDIPKDITYPVITKTVDTTMLGWKSFIHICNNEDELISFIKDLNVREILVQEYVDKIDEYGYEGFSISHGEDSCITMRSSQVYNQEGGYTPYWYMTDINEDPEFINKLKDFVREVEFEGIWEFEFLVTRGKLYFLEFNFRNTVLGWATTVAGLPSATMWCEASRDRYVKVFRGDAIPKGFTAMAECYDYDARVKTKKVSHRQWMKEYKSVNAKLYRGRKDFIPFLAFMWYKLTKMRRK